MSPRGPSWAARIGRNFIHLFALLLWAAAALAWLAGLPELLVAIGAVIVVNALFSFAQEWRAERAVGALRQVLPQLARVRRDGRTQVVEAESLVPGDVMLLSAGDRISADGQLIAGVELAVDMSTLTGESRPVRRRVAPGSPAGAGFDAPERVFAGTYAAAGVGEAVVTATGMRTELGAIAGLTQRTARHAIDQLTPPPSQPAGGSARKDLTALVREILATRDELSRLGHAIRSLVSDASGQGE